MGECKHGLSGFDNNEINSTIDELGESSSRGLLLNFDLLLRSKFFVKSEKSSVVGGVWNYDGRFVF